jgi:hypothetical protein
MRALFILVLAGGLLWLALQGFRSVRAEEERPPEPPRAGFLLPPRPSTSEATVPAASPTAPSPAVVGETNPGPEVVPPPAQPTPPVRVEPSKPPVGAAADRAVEAPRASPTPDELGLASLILLDPLKVPGFLEGAGSSLPKERKQLALAMHHLLLGSEAEVRRIAEDIETGGAVRVEEVAYLREALMAANPTPAVPGDSPLLLATSLALLARSAEGHLAAGRHRDAASAYGQILLGVLDAPWPTGREQLQSWSRALARSQEGYRWNPGAEWPSVAMQVGPGDSLISVRKRALEEHPELLVCTGEIARANGLHGEVIHPGDVLKIPTSHPNVLVDLDSHWALYRMDSEVVAAWEIGIGKPGNETPPGEYRAGEKTKEPMWFRAGHPPVPFGDPENPLGSRWIAWQNLNGANSSLGFHGTSDPDSIGEDRSQGCVRMRKEAIEELYEILPRGAVIRVRP